MSNDKDPTADKKFEPTGDNEHSDSNKRLDNNETADSALSDCSSESGSSNKQVVSDSDYSLDSGHDSDYTSKTSLSSFSETSKDGDSNYLSLDHTSCHNSGCISRELQSSDVRPLADGTDHPSLNSLSDNESDHISETFISNTTSLHNSLKGNSVAGKVTSCCESDYGRLAEGAFIHVGRRRAEIKSPELTELVQSDKTLTIPSHKRAEKDLPNARTIKQGLSKHIPKDSLYDTRHTNDTDSRSLILVTEALSEKVTKYITVKELVAELNKLAASDNAGDSISTIKDHLKLLKNELDDLLPDISKILPEVTLSSVATLDTKINDLKVKVMDLVRYKMIVKRDTNYQQNDFDIRHLLYETLIGDSEKKYSVLKSAKKEMEDYLYCPNGPVIRQDLTVMYSTVHSENPNGEFVGS